MINRNPKTLTRAAALLLLVLILAGCRVRFQLPVFTRDKIGNAHSRLLPTLLQKSDVPGEWIWQEPVISQEDEDFIEPTHVENATEILMGAYGSAKIFVNFTHRLERYKQPVTLDGLEAEEGLTPNQNQAANFPDLAKTGQFQLVTCDPGRQPNTLGGCQITIGYHYIVSQLSVYANRDLSQPEMLNLLTTALKQIDQRVVGIDDPNK